MIGLRGLVGILLLGAVTLILRAIALSVLVAVLVALVLGVLVLVALYLSTGVFVRSEGDLGRTRRNKT